MKGFLLYLFMEKVSFLWFEEKKKDHMDRGLLIFTLFAIAFTMIWLGGEDFFGWKVLETIGILILALTGIAYLFLGIYSFSEKEKLSGSFKGNIDFGPDSISVGSIKFLLEEIVKMEILDGDYNGKQLISRFSVSPKVSNGVYNSLNLILKDNSEKKFYFQLNYENEFQKKMRDLLIYYHFQGKISFLALIQYIGISDSYEQIQDFKKELVALSQENKN